MAMPDEVSSPVYERLINPFAAMIQVFILKPDVKMQMQNTAVIHSKLRSPPAPKKSQ